jgi:hypothetical protein
MKTISTKTIASQQEIDNRNQLLMQFKNCPIPENEMISNLGLFQKRQELTKQLFFAEIYKKILNIHGVIFEFGTRWGQNLVTLNNLRGIFEPYNYSRKIVGFDTFSGFSGVSNKDGNHSIIADGAFGVSENYFEYLQGILKYHETESPLSHISKNLIIKGDAGIELNKYFSEHPETIVAFAYFDFDIYEPTKKCLELIKPYLTKGTILGFDELLDPHFPGETRALKDVFGLNNYSITRFPFCGIQSYVEIK